MRIIENYIQQSAVIPVIQTISITGGEPFLDYKKVCTIARLVHASGKRLTVITNGYWANSMDIVMERLSQLKDYGLVRLSISHDNYHKQFIKTQNIKNILESAIKLSLPTSLAIVVRSQEKASAIIGELGDSLIATDIRIAPCLPVGGAKKIFEESDYIRKFDIKDKLACFYGKIMLIHYDGYIYPCCSQMIVSSGLRIGKAADMNLKDALFKLKNNKLLHTLRNSDLKIFLKALPESEQLKLPKEYVNACEFCGRVINRDHFKYFRQLVAEN